MSRLSSHIRQRLSTKLSLSILLLTVPFFVMVLGLLFLQSRHIILGEAKERASSVLETTTQRVVRHLRTVENATNSNDWLVQEKLQPDSLLSLTNRIVRQN